MEASAVDLRPLPPPPADLATRPLPIVYLDRSWYRIHACAHGALFFNRRPVARFNAPFAEYATLYLGSDLPCCFVETFGRLTTAAGLTVHSVSQAQLVAACLTEVTALRPLALVDLTRPELRRLDADARLFAGNHAQAQLWGRALWAHPTQPDGLLFPARHDPSLLSVTLFERAEAALRVGAPHSLSALPVAVLGALLNRYDFRLRP